MGNSIDNIVIYNGYPLSIFVAVTFHCLLLAVLLYLQSNRSPEAMELVQPTVIKALFIDENPQVVNQQNLERQRLERVEQQRVAQERERQRVAEEQRAAEQAEAQRQADAERAREQERERSALVERQRLEREQAERQRQETERLERERQAEAERRRQQELAQAEQQRLQQERERQQQESAQAAQAEAARTEYELVQSATGLIQEMVQKNWSRPPSARNGMRAILQIRMLPTGELVDAVITESSGDPAFDRAAETAVYRAAPFRELATLPITIFNANFRVLLLTFQPEDLLN